MFSRLRAFRALLVLQEILHNRATQTKWSEQLPLQSYLLPPHLLLEVVDARIVDGINALQIIELATLFDRPVYHRPLNGFADPLL